MNTPRTPHLVSLVQGADMETMAGELVYKVMAAARKNSSGFGEYYLGTCVYL